MKGLIKAFRNAFLPLTFADQFRWLAVGTSIGYLLTFVDPGLIRDNQDWQRHPVAIPIGVLVVATCSLVPGWCLGTMLGTEARNFETLHHVFVDPPPVSGK